MSSAFDFDPQDPYPLASWDDCFRQAAKDHSRAVDSWLGFDLLSAEVQVRAEVNQLRFDIETWHHLSPQIFQTSYLELRAILHWISPEPRECIADLGCAYGRMAFVLQRHHPESRFVGIDVCKSRLTEAQRVAQTHRLSQAIFEHVDLVIQPDRVPKADHFFVYDIGTTQDSTVLMKELSRRSFKTLVLRGGRIRHLAHQHLLPHQSPQSSLELLNLALYRFS
jgi:hypothetical protein